MIIDTLQLPWPRRVAPRPLADPRKRAVKEQEEKKRLRNIEASKGVRARKLAAFQNDQLVAEAEANRLGVPVEALHLLKPPTVEELDDAEQDRWVRLYSLLQLINEHSSNVECLSLQRAHRVARHAPTRRHPSGTGRCTHCG